MTALVSDTVIAGAPDDCQLLEPLNCAELACYVDLRPALDRVWIAYLRLHCVSVAVPGVVEISASFDRWVRARNSPPSDGGRACSTLAR
jgi:hypothetical protein